MSTWSGVQYNTLLWGIHKQPTTLSVTGHWLPQLLLLLLVLEPDWDIPKLGRESEREGERERERWRGRERRDREKERESEREREGEGERARKREKGEGGEIGEKKR